MPKRHLERFPEQFAMLTDQAIQRMQSSSPGGEALLTFELRTSGNAVNLQMQLRQYWNALSDARAKGMPDYDPNFRRAGFTHMLAVRYKAGTKTTIEIVHRGQLSVAKSISEALGDLNRQLEKQPAVPDSTVVADPKPKKPGGTQDGLIDELFKPAT